MRDPSSLVAEARRWLGIRRLALSIHDASFPAGDLDIGRGSPYTESAFSLLERMAELGFDVLQLGPQGETSPGDPSPYDSAAFSRSTLSIAAAALVDEDAGELLSEADLRTTLEGLPEESALRADHELAWRIQRRLLILAFRRFRDRSTPVREQLGARAEAFGQRHAEWLARDGLYDALAGRHHGLGFEAWPDPERRLLHPDASERETFEARRRGLEALFAEALAFHRFTQWLAHEQHARFRRRMETIGMAVYGDLQIGLADRDVWALQPNLLPGYRLGAPPSRTNPAGQPWGYRVFDPDRYRDAETKGSVAWLLRWRLGLFFEAYDALRIDHPHGLVCPWVYRADEADLERAVRSGVRLFASALAGHPELARYDIPRPDQIDRGQLPWADRWVSDLDPSQVDRYARLFDEVVRAAQHAGHGSEAILCEVLSTLPFPLACVMERHRLSRFRVTGKIDPADPEDPYRVETAAAVDWVMIGTHDTPSIWSLLESWPAAQRAARAAYAAERLEPDPERRVEFAALLDREPTLLAQALLAELFVGPAENVMVFFTDLFGIAETYNAPGTVSPLNWSLRLPPDYHDLYRERLTQHRALNLPLAFALALRARGEAPPALIRSLFEAAKQHGPVPDAWRTGLR